MATPDPKSFPHPTVVVLGGGFAGSMTVVALLREATSPLTLHLVEKTDKVGLGTAYGTRSWSHLLNVPASKMGAIDDPEHFFRWIGAHPEALPSGAPAMQSLGFAPRRTFGTYLRAVFEDAVGKRSPLVDFQVHENEAVDVRVENGRAVVTLAEGPPLVADRVVLALGNFPPRPLVATDHPLYGSTRYVNDPWKPGALDAVSDDASPALLVGTGLTMVDVALSLRERRPRKTMTALSRRGYLPQVHRLGAGYPLAPTTAFPTTVRALLRWMRDEVKKGARTGHSWQAVLDSLRPHSQTIWRSLSHDEQRRFLRHARIQWDVHRHRIAPEIADRLAAMRAAKTLAVLAGRIERLELAVDGISVTYRPRGGAASKSFGVGHIVNCTGPDARYAPSASPLVASLLRRGLVRPHRLGLALDGTAEGRLFQQDGAMSPFLFAIGPMRQPILWETTAVPELRVQTAAMGRLVLSSLGPAATVLHPDLNPRAASSPTLSFV